MARSLTRLPEFSSRKKIRENEDRFLRRLHEEYKTAQELLISTYLEVEEDLAKETDQSYLHKKKHWIMVLELCFNTFVWIAEGWERYRVKLVFKGPKHGSTKSRNVSSVLTVIRGMNKRSSDFAIALDFCSFECIADVLRVRINLKVKSSKNQYIEVKEGRVNNEMLKTIASQSTDRYVEFFQKYGDAGIKQIERYFRQSGTFFQRAEMVKGRSGDAFETPAGLVLVQEASIKERYYLGGINCLLKHLKTRAFGSFVVDGCLWVGAVRKGDPVVVDFFVRHSIHHTFSEECAICGRREGWEQELASLKLFDGLRIFGSVPFEGFIGKPISDRDMLDILFGRLRFFYHLDGDRFLNLCHAVGIEAGYSSEKDFRRRRSSGDRVSVGFRRRLLWMRKKGDDANFFLGEGMLHDMCLNWVHPYWWVSQTLHQPDFTNVGAVPDRILGSLQP
jgi:hypothetical protein